MGCFGRLGLLKSHKIAPETGVRHVQQQQQQPAKTATAGRRPAANKERQKACDVLDKALWSILQLGAAAGAGQHAAPKLPSSFGGLAEQVQAASEELQSKGKASAVLAVIKQTSDKLLLLQQQQARSQDIMLCTETAPICPTADALFSTVGSLLFAQVVLDTAAVLQRRHQQLLQLAQCLGFSSCSSLAACLQPATKTIVAGIVLGSHAQGNEQKVPCTIIRRSAFWDALPQLQQQGITQEQLQHKYQQADGKVLLAKLFPRFVDEDLLSVMQQQPSQSAAVEAGEGHGLRKEFFQAAAVNWTTSAPQQPALLVYLRGSGTWWLNSSISQQMPELQNAYWTMGWLMAQALTNRCTLGLPMAPLLFHLLMPPDGTLQPTLDLLQQHDPDSAASIRSVLKLPSAQYQQLLEVEQLPSSMSRQQYVAHAVRQLLVADVQWQLKAVRQGFAAGTSTQVLQECCLYGSDLAAAICGCSADDAADFSVQQAFRVVMEDGTGDAHSSSAITCRCLWQVLDSWDLAQKKAFVKFSTGTDRLPPHPGCEQLVISFPFVACGLRDQQQLLATLPQSHTCSNTLELPDYADALMATQPDLKQEWSLSHKAGDGHGCPKLVQACCRVLDQKLKLAVTCTSYGLDGS